MNSTNSQINVASLFEVEFSVLWRYLDSLIASKWLTFSPVLNNSRYVDKPNHLLLLSQAISLVSAMSRFTCISEQRSRLLQHDSDPLSTSQPVHDHDHIVEDDQAENSLSSKTISFEDCLRDRSPRSNRHYVGYPNLTSLFPKNTVIQAKNKKYISRRQSAKTWYLIQQLIFRYTQKKEEPYDNRYHVVTT